jgi:hypothetical protein
VNIKFTLKKIVEDKAHEKYVSDFSIMYVFFPFC